MSNGSVHDAATIAGALVIGVAMSSSPLVAPFAVATSVGVLIGGLIISPDVDVSSPRGSKSLNRWRLGRGKVTLDLRLLWKPYQKLAPHRSWLSHSPIVGSLFRFVYLSVLTLGVLPYLLVTSFGVATTLALLIGNELGAGIHLLADKLYWGFYLALITVAIVLIKVLEMGLLPAR